MPVKVNSTCKVTNTSKVLVKHYNALAKSSANDKYTTVFIEKYTGKFLGENEKYIDTETYDKITFPSIKINVRSIPNEKEGMPREDGTDYRKDFEKNVFDHVSPSLTFLIKEYKENFEAMLEKNEKPDEFGGNKKEQSCVVIYNDNNYTITAVVLPDTINTYTADMASAQALSCCAQFIGYADYLLPNDNKDYTAYFKGLKPLTVPDKTDPTKMKGASKQSDTDFQYPANLWGLAMYVYVIKHKEDYNLKFSQEEIDLAKKYESILLQIAVDSKMPVISESHTHPDYNPPLALKTSTTYGGTTITKESGYSPQDRSRAFATLLPDMIVTFFGRKVKKMEVIYSDAKKINDVTLVAKSKVDFFNNMVSILYYNLMSKYKF